MVSNGKSAWSVWLTNIIHSKGVGHWTLVHVGFGMSLINEDEAEATLKVLKELGEVSGAPGDEGIGVEPTR